MSLKNSANRSFGPELRLNVNFIIPDKDGNVLLFHRFCKKSLEASGQDDPWHDSVEKWYDIPGGRVDHPEIHIHAVKREPDEELNIKVKDVIHLSTMQNPVPKASEGSTRDIYVVVDYEGEPFNKAGHDEGHLSMERVKPSDVPTKVGSRIDEEAAAFLIHHAEALFQNMINRRQCEVSHNPAYTPQS